MPHHEPLSQIVKKETAETHRAAEAVLLPVLQSVQSLAGYASVLKTFYGFFQPVQERIQAGLTPAHLPDLSQRRSAQLLLLDLQSLGEHETPAICKALPHIRNSAEAFGALYVLEGSTLGGKMIARMLKANALLSLTDDNLHFFSGYKEETGPMWTAFLVALNQQPDTEAVVRTAAETFTSLQCWLQKNFAHETAR